MLTEREKVGKEMLKTVRNITIIPPSWDLMLAVTKSSIKPYTVYRPMTPGSGAYEWNKKEWLDTRKRIDSFFRIFSGKKKEIFDSLLKEWHDKYDSDTNRHPVPVRERDGYVYLIKNNKFCFKIGISKFPKKRIEHLEVKLPFPVDIIHTFKCDDSLSAEQKLHEHFKKRGKWIKGEWFRLSKKDIKIILQINLYKNERFLTKDQKLVSIK